MDGFPYVNVSAASFCTHFVIPEGNGAVKVGLGGVAISPSLTYGISSNWLRLCSSSDQRPHLVDRKHRSVWQPSCAKRAACRFRGHQPTAVCHIFTRSPIRSDSSVYLCIGLPAYRRCDGVYSLSVSMYVWGKPPVPREWGLEGRARARPSLGRGRA